MNAEPGIIPLYSRRLLLGSALHGPASIALASLLASENALAAEKKPPIRPIIDPAKPYAPRSPHFSPAAKRMLVIFVSGALSHVDSFDYKPELLKRHGQPLPGSEKLITFQGENGALAQPLWKFRPRGKSG